MSNVTKRHWVALEGMEFYAHHGVTPEEQKVGGNYKVNVYVGTFFENAMLQDQLELTVDYAVIHEICKAVMAESSKLIEHVAGKIIEAIKNKFDTIYALKVEVAKLNPPLNGQVQLAKVVVEETFG